MTPTNRDQKIIELVARFKQLSSAQIRELVFRDSPGRTNCDRALRRLVRSDMLARIERRLVGGANGGAGQYTYQLGRAASDYYEGRHRPVRAVDLHRLAIADTFLIFKRLEWDGQLELVGMSNEPDCWMTIGSYELHPDLLLDVKQRSGAQRWIWFEVDRATESDRHTKEKLNRYWQAALHNAYEREQGTTTALKAFPVVVWATIDEARARVLKWLISQMPDEAQRLFRVTTMEKLPALFSTG